MTDWLTTETAFEIDSSSSLVKPPMLILGSLSCLASVHGKRLRIAEHRNVSGTRINSSDLAAGILLACIVISVVYEMLK